MGTRVAKHIARELYDSRSRLASLHEVSSSYTTMEVEGELLEVSELQRDVLYLEEKHAEAFDMSCMSPPLSPSPILSPNTPSTELPSAFQFRFKIDTSSEFEAGMLDAADSLKDNFLTMNARVTSPGAARVKNEWSRVETAGTVHEVQVTEANSGEQDALSAEGEDLALPAESECSPNAILTTLEYAAYAPGEEQSEVSSPGSNGPEGRPEVDIAVDKHPIDVTHDAEGSDIDLDIEKLALEIEAHNRATSNAVMSRFVEVKKKLVQHEQETLELARMQHQKELSRMNGEMARLRTEHDDAVKRARDMVDMANRAAELVALRGQQNRNTAALCAVLWKWKEETNWQKYLKRMERKATQQYEQNYRQRQPLRKWRKLTKLAKLHMLEFKTKMSLKEEKERLAAESAGEVQRLHQDAADLRSQLAEEKKAREKLEEDMKRAFMRGVCALNIEALAMMKRGGLQAVQDDFDSPNTVVTGPPLIKEHVQYYEEVEPKSASVEAANAAVFYRSTSPGAVRNASPSKSAAAAGSLNHGESPPRDPPPGESVGQELDAPMDGTAPEQRTVSEQLKRKLAAVMGSKGTGNGAANVSSTLGGGVAFAKKLDAVVDVRPQSRGNGGVVKNEAINQGRRTSEVRSAVNGVRVGAEPPRWN